MNPIELKQRTKQFALRILKLVGALPTTIAGRAIANQLVRSGTSVAANYRATCRARSKNEFIAKVGVVLEEADETLLWLELIAEAKLLPLKRVEYLLVEANELVAIMVASRKSASSNLQSTI
ncbi:MAG TPA: four helix bundle protein [Chthoniobacterales bacterium]|jgi:four helix bundle protein|nr:four helix bundle protein [Chthoniobacterales bacterium]